MKVIYILWLRQLKRYVRSKARIIGSLGQPLLFFLALGFGFGPIYTKAGGGSYIQFLAPGIIIMSILFTATFSGIEVLWDRQFGFLKETLVAPVSRLRIILGRIFGGATVAVVQGLIVFGLCLAVGFRPVSYSLLPLALVYMILMAITFTALGTAIASFLEDMQGFQIIINFLVMPMFFLSGALFPLQNLPKPVVIISALNPLAYGVDGLRGTLINMVHFGLVTDFCVLLAMAAFLTLAGAFLFSRIEV
ncbi:MAG: Inner membrane transport permease YadH [Syntrophorhabdus sp. PtaU1.Bin002]|nr:MAG: Inner membrane transport permease YadH [Syntrophorhabdus sp. PtaU1.Bin002]